MQFQIGGRCGLGWSLVVCVNGFLQCKRHYTQYIAVGIGVRLVPFTSLSTCSLAPDCKSMNLIYQLQILNVKIFTLGKPAIPSLTA